MLIYTHIQIYHTHTNMYRSICVNIYLQQVSRKTILFKKLKLCHFKQFVNRKDHTQKTQNMISSFERTKNTVYIRRLSKSKNKKWKVINFK